MVHLIDKDALVAEIDRLEKIQPIDELHPKEQNKIDWLAGKEFVIITLQVFLDTLEVKEIQEEPASDGLEEASKEWLAPQLDKSYVNYGEVKMMELTHFDGYAMLDAIDFGAKWGKNQAMAEIQAQSMALAHGCPEEPVSEDLEEAAEKCIKSLIPETELNSTTPFALEYVVELLHKAFKAGTEWQKEQIIKDAVDGTMGFVSIHLKKPNFGEKFKEGDKVKVLVIKEE